MKKECSKEDFFQVLGHISVFFATADFLATHLIFSLVNKEKITHLKPLKDSMTLTKKLI